MLIFVCPECEVFSLGKAEDYQVFLEKHGEATAESFGYGSLEKYMQDTLRLHRYFEESSQVSAGDLTRLLVDLFTKVRDGLVN